MPFAAPPLHPSVRHSQCLRRRGRRWRGRLSSGGGVMDARARQPCGLPPPPLPPPPPPSPPPPLPRRERPRHAQYVAQRRASNNAGFSDRHTPWWAKSSTRFPSDPQPRDQRQISGRNPRLSAAGCVCYVLGVAEILPLIECVRGRPDR